MNGITELVHTSFLCDHEDETYMGMAQEIKSVPGQNREVGHINTLTLQNSAAVKHAPRFNTTLDFTLFGKCSSYIYVELSRLKFRKRIIFTLVLSLCCHHMLLLALVEPAHPLHCNVVGFCGTARPDYFLWISPN